jgi:hypothetical protein
MPVAPGVLVDSEPLGVVGRDATGRALATAGTPVIIPVDLLRGGGPGSEFASLATLPSLSLVNKDLSGHVKSLLERHIPYPAEHVFRGSDCAVDDYTPGRIFKEIIEDEIVSVMGVFLICTGSGRWLRSAPPLVPRNVFHYPPRAGRRARG